MTEKLRTVIVCGKCERAALPKDCREVNVRVTGRATQYHAQTQMWCGRCRAVYFGSWKHAVS